MLASHFCKNIMFVLLAAFFSLPLSIGQGQTPTRPSDPYKTWLNQDVRWIISDQERTDFKKLSDDKQRDQFIQAFWERRNPTPGAPENAFKKEHYRRIAYANQHFAAGIIPGWKTDRGRFYIMWGPPDTVVRRLKSDNPPPGGIQTGDLNSEEWHWIYVDCLGCNVTIKFVDPCGCGEYQMNENQDGIRSLRELGSTCLIDQVVLP